MKNAAQVAAAYRVCRTIARREARNFYYAFLALPEPKRDAICAIYAFMRIADDLSDDESLPHAERRVRLDRWIAQWRSAAAGAASDDPVFIAVDDARRRFGISLHLLEQLVEGTTMDLRRPDSTALTPQPAAPGGPAACAQAAFTGDTYATFDDLYRYCYLVASVVGLVCICIFEYADTRAELLAEELGVAFQLTNILRDVREDALRGRIYLPLEDLRAHGVSTDDIRAGVMTENMRGLLAFEARRAELLYRSGEALVPLVAADSRPALWVLMTIYHRLLDRIRRGRYEIFASRVSVPTAEKLRLLGRGVAWTAISNALRSKMIRAAEQ